MHTHHFSISCILNSKLVTNFKNVSKSKPKFNEDSHYSITDYSINISRYDDIMDLKDISVSTIVLTLVPYKTDQGPHALLLKLIGYTIGMLHACVSQFLSV